MKTKCKICGAVMECDDRHSCSLRDDCIKRDFAYYLCNPCESCLHNDGNKIADTCCENCVFVAHTFRCLNDLENNYEPRPGAVFEWY